MDESMMMMANPANNEGDGAEEFLVDYLNNSEQLQQFQPQRLEAYSKAQA